MNFYLNNQIKKKMQVERAHDITRKMGHSYGTHMRNIDNILRSLCRSVVVSRVGLEGTPHDCDEHSVPSGRFLTCGSRAALAQGAAMRLRAALANGLHMKDRLMAAIFVIQLNDGREADDIYFLILSLLKMLLIIIFVTLIFMLNSCWNNTLITIDYDLDYDFDSYVDYQIDYHNISYIRYFHIEYVLCAY